MPKPFASLTVRQNLEVAVHGPGGAADLDALLEAAELAAAAHRRPAS